MCLYWIKRYWCKTNFYGHDSLIRWFDSSIPSQICRRSSIGRAADL